MVRIMYLPILLESIFNPRPKGTGYYNLIKHGCCKEIESETQKKVKNPPAGISYVQNGSFNV